MAEEIESYYLAYFRYFYSREEKKIPAIWTSITNQDATTQITSRLAELREQAFISYVPLKIIEQTADEFKSIIYLLRDIIIFSSLFCQRSPASAEPSWPECSQRLHSLKAAFQASEAQVLGETTILVAEQLETFDYVSLGKQIFNKNNFHTTDVCCGKLYQFADSDQLGLSHDFLLIYDGEKQAEANSLLTVDFPAFDVSITKLEKLILNFQQQRLEMIEKKKSIDSFLGESLESASLKSRKPAERMEFLENVQRTLSDNYAWLNRASSLVKNAQTVVHSGLENLTKFKARVYSPEKMEQIDFIDQRYLSTFEEYEKQLSTDYDYLEKTLDRVQDTMRTFNSHLDVEQKRLQEVFYRRTIILFLLLITSVVGGLLLYIFYSQL